MKRTFQPSRRKRAISMDSEKECPHPMAEGYWQHAGQKEGRN